MTAILLGDREAEITRPRHLGDEPLGHELVVMMDALGVRRDLALGERADVGADLGEDLVERPDQPALGRDRTRADLLDGVWCDTGGSSSPPK